MDQPAGRQNSGNHWCWTEKRKKEWKEMRTVWETSGTTSSVLTFILQGYQMDKRERKGQKMYLKKKWLKTSLIWGRKRYPGTGSTDNPKQDELRGTSLVAQCIRLHSQCRGPRVQSLVRELDPTCMLQLRVCMQQLRSLPAATKTRSNQINK